MAPGIGTVVAQTVGRHLRSVNPVPTGAGCGQPCGESARVHPAFFIIQLLSLEIRGGTTALGR